MTSPSIHYDPASIRHYVSKKPPEDFPLDDGKDPITGAKEGPPEPRKLPLGPSNDPFSTTDKIERLKRRHKPQPKGRG